MDGITIRWMNEKIYQLLQTLVSVIANINQRVPRKQVLLTLLSICYGTTLRPPPTLANPFLRTSQICDNNIIWLNYGMQRNKDIKTIINVLFSSSLPWCHHGRRIPHLSNRVWVSLWINEEISIITNINQRVPQALLVTYVVSTGSLVLVLDACIMKRLRGDWFFFLFLGLLPYALFSTSALSNLKR